MLCYFLLNLYSRTVGWESKFLFLGLLRILVWVGELADGCRVPCEREETPPTMQMSQRSLRAWGENPGYGAETVRPTWRWYDDTCLAVLRSWVGCGETAVLRGERAN